MTQIFISYKSEERDFALRVRDALRAYGYVTWIDKDDIPLGTRWRVCIEQGLSMSDYVVGIISQRSLQSTVIGYELAHGRKRERLIPLVREPVEKKPKWLRDLQGYICDKDDEDRCVKEFLNLLLAQIPPALVLPPLPPPPPLNIQLADTLQTSMLKRVHEVWIENVLNKVIADAPVGVVVIPDPPKEGQISTYLQVIVGGPGSGKTMYLLQEAEQMLDQALYDPSVPMPVILDLSSWRTTYNTLEDWAAERMQMLYAVNKNQAYSWIMDGKVDLLLDGFDEIHSPDDRKEFVKAITLFYQANAHSGARTTTNILLTSRPDAYRPFQGALGQPFERQLADVVQDDAVDYVTYLASSEQLLKLMKQDEMQTLVKSPLWLQFMIEAYTNENFPQHLPEDQRRNNILQLWTKQQFAKLPNPLFSLQDTYRYLAWLADHMAAHGSTLFHIEELQSDWLQPEQQRQYRLLGFLIGAILFGIVGAISGALFFWLGRFYIWRIPIGLITGLLGGAIAGLLFMLPGKITPVAITKLSFWGGLKWGVASSITLGLISAIAGRLIDTPQTPQPEWFGVAGGLLIGAIYGGLLTNKNAIEVTSQPNQGMLRSIKLALLLFVLVMVLGSITVSLVSLWVFSKPPGGALGIAVAGAVLSAFIFGGGAVLKHGILRGILHHERSIPFNYAKFLDFAVEIGYLHKVGGGYKFIHRELLNYFAQLSTKGRSL